MVWKQRLDQAAFEITGSAQDKKPSEISKKALDSVGVERGHGSGGLQEQASMIRSKIYEAIYFQLVDNQYIDICPVSYFHFLFGKFQNSTGQYRPPSSLHTAPQKVCHTHTKGKKIDREASQTTAKSKCSQFKTEMGKTTCLEVAYAQLPSSSNAFRTFIDNSPEMTLFKYLTVSISMSWNSTSSLKPWLPFVQCCFALENSEAIKTRPCGGFLVTSVLSSPRDLSGTCWKYFCAICQQYWPLCPHPGHMLLIAQCRVFGRAASTEGSGQHW